LAVVAHEAIGHGAMCLASGGRIRLLTTVYFRCVAGNSWVAATGPLMNLLVALVCWSALRAVGRLPPEAGLFL
ncbi:hypothetical protein, partial [Klebsiella pneumoniae]|uniref:hypothetical protein n=1 Tax=Klebsiella pneumoniae TaxID=573 RepID=UPI0019545C82